MEDKRDSLIFYRSFYEAIRELPLDQQGEVYNALFEYALDFNEIALSGIPKVIFTLIKPQLEANRKKYLNGKKAKTKQHESKTEAKEKQNGNKVQGNVNVNVNDNVNVLKEFALNNHTDNSSAYLLKSFYNLGYLPSKTETVETFRLWFKEKIIDNHTFKTSKEINKIVDNFEVYWGEQKKPISNFKTTFMNNPLLKEYGK